MALLTVSGFPSNRIVQIRIFNFTTAIETIPWTSLGVSERADGQGFSTYFYKFALIAGNEYIIDWMDNSTPVNTASESISVLQSGVAQITTRTDFVEKWILNRLVENPPGTFTLFDDDGVRVLRTWTVVGTERSRAV